MPDSTTPPRFTLYSYWRTSATYRVRVALNLKGVVAEERNVDIDRGEQRGDAFLKLNPMGAIPALLDRDEPDAGVLTQSTAILEFLDETYPSPPLLPGEPHARARVRSLAAMLAGDTHPLITPRIKKYLTSAGGFDDAAWRVADPLVHDRPAGVRDEARRSTGRRLLSRRPGDDGRHLPGQHHRRDARLQDRRRGHSHGGSHHGQL